MLRGTSLLLLILLVISDVAHADWPPRLVTANQQNRSHGTPRQGLHRPSDLVRGRNNGSSRFYERMVAKCGDAGLILGC